MLKKFQEDNVGLWPALLRASCLLLGITILGGGAKGIGSLRVEKAQVFFSKAGSSSHTLHYSNIQQDFKVKELEEILEKVRDAVQRRATQETFTRPLRNNDTRSGHFMEDPTMWHNKKAAHRVKYRLSALLSRVGRLFQLFQPINEQIEEFGLLNPKEINELTFKHRHTTIFTAVELDKLWAKQQKADTVAKLGLMASKEISISNSQVELTRLTAEVTNALDAAWGSIDTINHVLLVCHVADKQVGVMESAMQAAMGGHVSVAAFTELNYARVALKINRDARAVGLDPLARHLSDYLQMETSFVAGPAGFSTMVHIPLIDMKSALTIWEHHYLPIPLDHGLYLNMGPAEYTHLAVTQDHKLNRAMTRRSLTRAVRWGNSTSATEGSS
jgi:hypothetical protein